MNNDHHDHTPRGDTNLVCESVSTATKRNRSRSDDKARLNDFMTLHGFQTTMDLAQLFGVGQTTTARWLRDAQKLGEGETLRDALQGPAFILFELMERGLETDDLRAMKAITKARAEPEATGDLKWEGSWTLQFPDYARQGVSIVTRTGHHVTVHSGWFRDRVAWLEKVVVSDEGEVDRRAAQKLLTRYRAALKKLAEIPR